MEQCATAGRPTDDIDTHPRTGSRVDIGLGLEAPE